MVLMTPLYGFDHLYGFSHEVHVLYTHMAHMKPKKSSCHGDVDLICHHQLLSQ